MEKRRNPSKLQKQQGIIDGWYCDADEYSAEDKWILAAARSTDVSAWPDGEHPCEALGPRIQGNPLGLDQQRCVPFNLEVPVYEDVPRSYGELWDYLAALESRYAPGHLAEGIVFHHPDGRRAKIKRKDFPRAALRLARLTAAAWHPERHGIRSGGRGAGRGRGAAAAGHGGAGRSGEALPEARPGVPRGLRAGVELRA